MADLEFYDGAASGQQIDDGIIRGIIRVSCGTISSLPVTINNSAITAKHIPIAVYSTYGYAQANRWKITTANGSLTIEGGDIFSGRNTGGTNVLLALSNTSI